MNKAMLIVLVVIAGSTAVAVAEEARPIGQVVAKLDKDSAMQFHAAQISPDGKLLLYVKAELIPPGGGRPRYSLVLCDLASGKETVLPTPVMSTYVVFNPLLANPVFDKDSRKIAIMLSEPGKCLVGLYDIATAKVTEVGPAAGVAPPMFDGRGRDLIVTDGAEDGSLPIYVAPSSGAPAKTLGLQGIVLAVQSGGDLIAAIKTTGRSPLPRTEDARTEDIRRRARGGGPVRNTSGNRRPTAGPLVLFDVAKNSEIATLPVGTPNNIYGYSPMGHPPRFTSDGRFFCWAADPENRKTVTGFNEREGTEITVDIGLTMYKTRIWDIQAGKELTPIADSIPLAPCKTGMLLRTGPNKDPVFQELPPGTVVPVDMPGAIYATSGEKVLWTRHDPASGGATLMMADIGEFLVPVTATASAPAAEGKRPERPSSPGDPRAGSPRHRGP